MPKSAFFYCGLGINQYFFRGQKVSSTLLTPHSFNQYLSFTRLDKISVCLYSWHFLFFSLGSLLWVCSNCLMRNVIFKIQRCKESSQKFVIHFISKQWLFDPSLLWPYASQKLYLVWEISCLINNLICCEHLPFMIILVFTGLFLSVHFFIPRYLKVTKKKNNRQRVLLCFILETPNFDSLLSYFCRCPLSVMVKALDCRNVVSEFELQLRYYVYFRTNTLGKGVSPLIFPVMNWIASLLFF